MITASQLRASRALLGIDQLTLAQRSGLSLPTIQRMETSGGLIRGNVDSLVKVVQALEEMGIELIGEGGASTVGGRGVRLREQERRITVRDQKLGSLRGDPAVALPQVSNHQALNPDVAN